MGAPYMDRNEERASVKAKVTDTVKRGLYYPPKWQGNATANLKFLFDME